MTNKQKQAISRLTNIAQENNSNWLGLSNIKAIETVLNLVEKQQKELEKKDKLIDNAISEIEVLRQYFSEALQPDFIRILEILKDKKVIDW